MGGFNDLDRFADQAKEKAREAREKIESEYEEMSNR